MPNVITQNGISGNIIKVIYAAGERGSQGPQGNPGPQGPPGPAGQPYVPGPGIEISGNVISATGKTSVGWGNITGNINDQTDLQQALAPLGSLDTDVITNLGNGTNGPSTVNLQIVSSNLKTSTGEIKELSLPVASTSLAGVVTADTMAQIEENTANIGEKLGVDNLTTDNTLTKVATIADGRATVQIGVANSGIGSQQIATGAVGPTKIAAGAINGVDNDASGVGTTKLALNTVGTPNLRNGAVNADKIDFASVGMHIYYATVGNAVTFTADADMYVEIEAMTGYTWGFAGATRTLDVTDSTGLTQIFKRAGGISGGDTIGRQMSLLALYSTTANTDVSITVGITGSQGGSQGGDNYFIVRCYKLAKLNS